VVPIPLTLSSQKHNNEEKYFISSLSSFLTRWGFPNSYIVKCSQIVELSVAISEEFLALKHHECFLPQLAMMMIDIIPRTVNSSSEENFWNQLGKI